MSFSGHIVTAIASRPMHSERSFGLEGFDSTHFAAAPWPNGRLAQFWNNGAPGRRSPTTEHAHRRRSSDDRSRSKSSVVDPVVLRVPDRRWVMLAGLGH